MNFWFKKKKIVLDCFTNDLFAFTHCKIDHAANFIPDWWKALPVSAERNVDNISSEKFSTLKSCRGFTRLYNHGIIIPSWEEIYIEVYNGNYQWKTSRGPSHISHHIDKQYDGFVDTTKYQHIKIQVPPWRLRTNRFVEFAFTDPIWNKQHIDNYVMLPGLMDFKYQHDIAVNLMVRNSDKEVSTVYLNVGDPLVSLLPLTEDNIELKHHYVSQAELRSISIGDGVQGILGTGKKYYQRKALVDQADNKQKNCPFGFGKK